MMNGFGQHGWGMGLTWIISFIILVVIVWLVFLLVKKNDKPHQKSALDVLKERYARGEISKEEYEEKKNGII